MNIGKIHYIMLDDTEYINTGGSQGTVGSRNYNRRFSAEQLAWLREELKHVDKSTPIVVGCHCPLYSYNSGLGVSIALQSSADVDNILGCFDGFSSVTFLTGHTHINRNIQSPKYANVYEHNIAAVCGTWWWTQQYGKNNLCKDGLPGRLQDFHGQRNRHEMAVQIGGTAPRTPVHDLRHERGQQPHEHRRGRRSSVHIG